MENKSAPEDFNEKRKDPRIDARIEVQFATQGEFATCYSKNISRGGIYLETKVLPDPNAKVELVLQLNRIFPDFEDEVVRLQGRVVRLMTVVEDKTKVHKVGIQFVNIQPQTQILLDRLYSRLQAVK